MSDFKYKKNYLYIEKISIKNLAEKYATPFYCYSTNLIIKKFKEFKKPFINTKITICYAVKANPNIAILKILSKLGCGAEVVSQGELERALKAKISKKKIIFSGVGKTIEEIEYAIKKKILQINVESADELKLISKIAKRLDKKVQIGIRINPDIDAGTHTKITTGTLENKFGLDINATEKIFKDYKNDSNIDIKGLSIHIGSQITSMRPFIKAFSKLANFVRKLNQKGIILEYLDLGGGIGVPYDKESTIDYKIYSSNVLKILKEFNCKLILEPGRFLIAESGILITKVLYIKKNKKINFAVINSGMNDLIRPALYDSYHKIQHVHKRKSKKNLYTIVGPICESADTFAKKNLLNELKTNDLLFFKNVGAYGASMSSSYNSRPIIAEIIVYKNKFSVIRNQESVSRQISKESIPNWIKKIEF